MRREVEGRDRGKRKVRGEEGEGEEEEEKRIAVSAITTVQLSAHTKRHRNCETVAEVLKSK